MPDRRRIYRGRWVIQTWLLALASVAAPLQSSPAAVPTRIAAAVGLPGYSIPGLPGAALSVIGACQIDNAGGVVSTCRVAGPGITYGVNDLALLAFDRYAHPALLSRTGTPTGDGAPGVGLGDATFGSTFFPRLSSSGGVAAVCFVNGSGFDPTNNTGYWTGTRAGIAPTLRSGSSDVPGIPGARFYGFISGFPCLTGPAGVAFTAQLAVGGSGPGAGTIDSYQGVWGPDASGALTLIARTGVAQGTPPGAGAPPVPNATYVQFNPRSLVLAGDARLAFAATLAGPAATPVNDTVLVERTPAGAIQIVAREGSTVPGHSALTFGSLDTSAYAASVGGGGTSINSAGDLAFGDIDPLDLPQRGLSRLWLRRADGTFHLLAARNAPTGDGAPVGLPGGGVFSVITSPALSSTGSVVFSGTVLGDFGVQISGLWTADPSGAVHLIARSGIINSPLSPPGIPGAMFAVTLPTQGTYRINARNQVVFRWKLEDGGGGVSTASDDALWAYDPAAGLDGIVRTGDTLPALPALGPITAINMFHGPAGDDDGRLTDLNALGEVAVTIQGSDSTGAIIVAQLPGVGACCRGATCSQDTSDACTGPASRFAGIGAACEAPAHPPCCAADFDQSGTLSVQDIFDFLSAWFAASPSANIDGEPVLTPGDVFAFLQAWFAGCR